jgi:hypothetical protein
MVYRSVFLLNRLYDWARKASHPCFKIHLPGIYINVPAFATFCYRDHLDIISIMTALGLFGAIAPVHVSCALVMSAIYDVSSQFQKNMIKKIQAC